jgi:hypothetical protein
MIYIAPLKATDAMMKSTLTVGSYAPYSGADGADGAVSTASAIYSSVMQSRRQEWEQVGGVRGDDAEVEVDVFGPFDGGVTSAGAGAGAGEAKLGNCTCEGTVVTAVFGILHTTFTVDVPHVGSAESNKVTSRGLGGCGSDLSLDHAQWPFGMDPRNSSDPVHVARFQTEFRTREYHWIPSHVRLKLCHACGQWQSSRESTALTVVNINYVQTLKACTY